MPKLPNYDKKAVELLLKIKAKAVHENITNDALCTKLGMDIKSGRSHMNKVLNGKHFPKLPKLLAIMDAVGFEVREKDK